MTTLDGGRTAERLPVLLSGESGTKLLGVPALPPLQEGDAVGRLIAEATVGLLQQWNCCDSVRGMCFDTTASNTGKVKCNTCIKILFKELSEIATYLSDTS